MKSYNGFSPEIRNEAGAWLNRQYASGALARPSACCACGQAAGVIDAHAEDYSKPFGPHIYQFPLCYRCHMMVHCRSGALEAWARYLLALEIGVKFPPFMWRDWARFKRENLQDGCWESWPVHDGRPAPGLHILIEIGGGKYARASAQERDRDSP